MNTLGIKMNTLSKLFLWEVFYFFYIGNIGNIYQITCKAQCFFFTKGEIKLTLQPIPGSYPQAFFTQYWQ